MIFKMTCSYFFVPLFKLELNQFIDCLGMSTASHMNIPLFIFSIQTPVLIEIINLIYLYNQQYKSEIHGFRIKELPDTPLMVETDYSQADVRQLKTNVEAFIEMLK